MRLFFLVLCGLLFLFADSAFAGATRQFVGKHGVSVTSRRYRKNMRHLLLAEFLKGDKQKVYKKYGFTPHRLRYSMAGVSTERWKYFDEGLEFIFDADDNLIEKRDIPVEHRRAGIK
jgi:hypothetical protein